MNLSADQPIGIFDSGVGGLTVAHAIKSLLPNEKIVYFGDTFHLPYGDKSSQTVRYYSRKISDFLLEKSCKTVLIACNTASASAFEEVTQHVGDRAIVMNVIDPVVLHLGEKGRNGKIGVIGTKGTINSGTYNDKITRRTPSTEVISKATPLFVPMIEEGFIEDEISNAIINAYLSDKLFEGIHTLILGCTHYPIIRRQIEGLFDFKVDVIDSANIVADELRRKLQERDLLNPENGTDKHEFYVSDYTEFFERISKMFFEEEVHLEKLDFWT
ncbi:MAG: glutamate racemase [Bacteroidales bacterium]|nr:glutamate racemase [Bacteroidales bacterium]